MEDIKNIVESLLLVAEEPLKIDRIKDILALAGKKEIQNAEEYNSTMFDQQKYDKADMVVLGVSGSKDFKEFEGVKINKK